ncbi:RNA-directed DNA polymerase [Belliella sp. DSM 111904]|uniref:RNA-directed DNA polymerase n=1 Tax=Belliella filtrata TaxID=2923435 RepID=A0ABS9V2R8_9BACT|nr:RNA-directed DNA polymerase [Belliella filtrata]MCH7410676.1 RNA-directed DNA polymerase [Belliella filtrata]
MTEEKLIELGYLPKELPPGFITESLSRNLTEVKSRWTNFETSETERFEDESRSIWNQRKADFYSKYGSSQCVAFSISKGKLARRVLKIPNPKHYITVSELISNNWELYQALFDNSPFSMSYPVEEAENSKRAVKTYSAGVPVLRNEILKRSARKLIQVKVDISNFYPTIYTHTIPWSILGKETAKRLLKTSKTELAELISDGNSEAINYFNADKLDSAVRACQDRQSIGIPIGPDSSHIVSELIACQIDGMIQEKFSILDVEAVRFYDDYYIFVNTLDEADKVIKGLQLTLLCQVKKRGKELAKDGILAYLYLS